MRKDGKEIWIVEDDNYSAFLLNRYLEQEGFSCRIFEAGLPVLDALDVQHPEMILLDIGLPDIDGLELCGRIREHLDLPVIMVTSRVEEADRLKGFGIGADDYICKPFSPLEVVARVQSVLRRVRPDAPDILEVGLIRMDLEAREAQFQNQALELTPVEFDLLAIFLSNPGKAFSRDELIEKVLGYENDSYARTIDTHVKNLRKKFSTLQPGFNPFQTVHGVGYKLPKPA